MAYTEEAKSFENKLLSANWKAKGIDQAEFCSACYRGMLALSEEIQQLDTDAFNDSKEVLLHIYRSAATQRLKVAEETGQPLLRKAAKDDLGEQQIIPLAELREPESKLNLLIHGEHSGYANQFKQSKALIENILKTRPPNVKIKRHRSNHRIIDEIHFYADRACKQRYQTVYFAHKAPPGFMQKRNSGEYLWMACKEFGPWITAPEEGGIYHISYNPNYALESVAENFQALLKWDGNDESLFFSHLNQLAWGLAVGQPLTAGSAAASDMLLKAVMHAKGFAFSEYKFENISWDIKAFFTPTKESFDYIGEFKKKPQHKSLFPMNSATNLQHFKQVVFQPHGTGWNTQR